MHETWKPVGRKRAKGNQAASDDDGRGVDTSLGAEKTSGKTKWREGRNEDASADVYDVRGRIGDRGGTGILWIYVGGKG